MRDWRGEMKEDRREGEKRRHSDKEESASHLNISGMDSPSSFSSQNDIKERKGRKQERVDPSSEMVLWS